MTVEEAPKVLLVEEESKKRANVAEEGKSDQKRRKMGLDVDTDRGVLFTTQNPHMLRQAGRDLLHMLKRTHNENQPEKPKEGDLEAQLKAEKEELKNNTFELLDDAKIPKGCGFVRTTAADSDPTNLVNKTLDRVLAKKENSRFLGRLSPMDHMCKPQLRNFEILAEKVIKPLFEGEKKTWALQFKARNNKSVEKEKVLKVIDQWTAGFPVSIDNPEICIMIEVTPIFLGLSVLTGWQKYFKYNVFSCMNPQQAKNEKEAMRAKQKSVEDAKKAEKKEEPTAENKEEVTQNKEEVTTQKKEETTDNKEEEKVTTTDNKEKDNQEKATTDNKEEDNQEKATTDNKKEESQEGEVAVAENKTE